MADYRLIHGDALEVLRGMADNSVDAIVADPPAGINFMGAKFDHDRGGRTQWVAWLAEIMAEAKRVIKPGGHALIWALPRTSHWTACALEDAGWEVRDRLTHFYSDGGATAQAFMDSLSDEQRDLLARATPDDSGVYHLFGSGFPKSHNVSVAIDKHLGQEREVVGHKDPHDPRTAAARNGNGNNATYGAFNEYAVPITAPATDAAKQWAGFGSTLKPSVENWILVRKSLSEPSIAANVLRHGVGGINIDACRVATDWATDPTRRGWQGGNTSPDFDGGVAPIHVADTPGHKRVSQPNNQGRFPSHLLLSHAPGCERRGSKRVKAEKHSGKPGNGKDGQVYGEGIVFTGNSPHYADADGRELVADWECHAGGTIAYPSYAYKSDELSLFDAPLFLLDRLQSLIEEVSNYSTIYNSPLRHAVEFYHSGRTQSVASLDGLAREVAGVLGMSGLLGSLFDCPSCRRFCDEHAHQILAACQDEPLSLPGVLARVRLDLSQLLHSPHCQCRVRPSNSDDVLSCNTPLGTDENRTFVHQPEILSLAPADHIEGMDEREQPQNGPHGNTDESNTSCTCNRETLRCNAHTSEVVGLLVSLVFDLSWRFILPAHIIQRSEIVVNLPKCPVKALDEQAGERKGSKPGTIYKTPRYTGNAYNNGAEGGGQKAFGYGDTGSASRFFTVFEPDPDALFVYAPKASRSDRSSNGAVNNTHPTAKSTQLGRWLSRLICPVGGTILDPFAGSGSLGVSAILEGFNWIGIDESAEYIAIAEARLAWAASQRPKAEQLTLTV